MRAFSLPIIAVMISAVAAYVDVECMWNSKTGSTYDLRPLTVTDPKALSYLIKDGDIPCTPEIEPTYSYVFNFCTDVTLASFPSGVCKDTQMGAALQYIDRKDGYKECNVIGLYDAARDDTYFSLLDPKDPSKGVSMKYMFGHKCPNGQLRSATIDVMCQNTKEPIIDSATEPTECGYHLIMRSMHGCPTECPITDKGLCNSHGHCAYDSKTKQPHCYCNKGYGGAACTPSSSSSSSGVDVYSIQLAFMIILLLTALVLTGFVGYLAYRITQFRKDQMNSFTSNYTVDRGDFMGSEMVGTGNY
mmetsp:Transcript_41280/g.71521  ORF Transcript_41280/g.71521 Transcript_41280/m.71521 type:complete len:303 (-) Transcript_41280:990-1898(-)